MRRVTKLTSEEFRVAIKQAVNEPLSDEEKLIYANLQERTKAKPTKRKTQATKLTTEEMNDMLARAVVAVLPADQAQNYARVHYAGREIPHISPVEMPQNLQQCVGKTVNFWGETLRGIPFPLLFTFQDIDKRAADKVVLTGTIAVLDQLFHDDKLIVNLAMNRVQFRGHEDRHLYNLELDNSFKVLWDHILKAIQ